jgi:hypothetical protein
MLTNHALPEVEMPPCTRTLCVIGFLLGCGSGREASFAVQSQEIVVTNGNSLNGNSLNGNSLNGNSLNGTALGSTLASISLKGVSLEDGPLDYTLLAGTVFVGGNSEDFYSGTDFIGAHFVATTDNGSTVTVRIDGIRHEPWPDNDVWEYFVSYHAALQDEWHPFCADAAGKPIPAIPVNGRWNQSQGVRGGGAKIADPNAFTFSCKGLGAIAKCVFPIGYKPWRWHNGHLLDRWHQACVRLIRADFCGTGRAYTVNGQRVNLYDGIGIQKDTENWLLEAEWDENGARCFNPVNRSHSFVPCFADRALAVCGLPLNFKLGALLMNETPLPVLQ